MGRRSNKDKFKKYQATIEKIMVYLMDERKKKDISRNAMAKLLEIDPAALDRIEKNMQTVSFELYLKYCDKLNIDPVITFQRAILK